METSEFGFEPFHQETLRGYLKSELKARKARNPKYSLRAFAKNLDINHSALSEIISGHRRVSSSTLEALLLKLKLSEEKKKQIRDSHKINPNAYQRVSDQRLDETTHWFFDVICELTFIENFKSDVEWISKAIDVSPEKVKNAIEVLKKYGELKEVDGKLRCTETGTSTLGNLNKKDVLIKLYEQNLTRQINSLKNLPPEEQCQTGLTICADPDDLPEVRQRIYKFQRDLGMYLGRKKSKPKDVYKLNIGFFPQTQVNKNKKEEPK